MSFLALDTRSATLIRRLLEPDAPHVQPVFDDAPPAPTPACLYIDGLGSPIEADVHLDEGDHVLLSQKLDFLRLGRGVTLAIGDQEPRVGRIASVYLEQTHGDVPALSLGVLIDSPEAASRAPAQPIFEDSPAPYGAPPMDAAEVVLPAMRAPEPFEPLRAEAHGSVVAALGPTDTWPSSPPFDLEAREAEAAAPAAEAPCVVTGEPGDIESESESEPTHAESDEASSRGADAMSGNEPERALDGVAPSDESIEEVRLPATALGHAGEVVQRVSRAAVQRLQQVCAERAPALRDGVRALWQLWLVWWARQASRLRHFRRTQRRRRTTAPAPRVAGRPRSAKGRAAAATPAPAPRPGRGRLLLVGVLAFGGVAGAMYALAPRPTPSTLDLHRAVAPQVATPLSDRPVAPSETATPAQPAATPSLAMPVEAPRGPAPAVAADEAPGGEASSSARAFGAATVPNGRTYSLRMSGPIDRIEGEPRRDGFVVRVPGRLSLDRASPIATSHPALSRSLVLNQGDRAELTIEFAKGKRPAYRVEAKGASLEVTVERL